MNYRIAWCSGVLLTVTGFVAGNVASQDHRPATESQASPTDEPQAGDEAESLIDTFARYAMPSGHHKILDRMIGRWNLKVKYRMNAETPVVESEGTCRRKWILGKRFVLEEFDGGYLALPFQGHALYGYDGFEGKYTSVWLDTMSTAVTTYLGECSEECKVITFTGLHGDPWTGSKRRSRGVTRFVDDNKHVVEIHEPDTDGREFKILEITYTRS